MEITMKRTDNGITLYADAKKVGEINFTLQEDGLYDIYHTEVDSSMNGKARRCRSRRHRTRTETDPGHLYLCCSLAQETS